jgi:hypothetical protein
MTCMRRAETRGQQCGTLAGDPEVWQFVCGSLCLADGG